MALINPDTLEIPPIIAGPRQLRPCGTSAAYERHRMRGERCPGGECYTWHRKAARARRAYLRWVAAGLAAEAAGG